MFHHYQHEVTGKRKRANNRGEPHKEGSMDQENIVIDQPAHLVTPNEPRV